MSRPTNEKLRLWDMVCTTPEDVTKRTSNGRFDFTAIGPQHQLERATQIFGPYGKRWGIRNQQWRVFTETQTTPDSGSKRIGDPPTIMLTAEFFYPAFDDAGNLGDTASFEIAVDQRFKAGDDCCKKMLTSLRSKALSWLGFNADVFQGKFDDEGYVREMRIKHSEDNKFVERALATIRTAKTQEVLDKSRKHTHHLIANSTITNDLGSDLLYEIAEREKSLFGTDGSETA
jgi:hypothetical protein